MTSTPKYLIGCSNYRIVKIQVPTSSNRYSITYYLNRYGLNFYIYISSVQLFPGNDFWTGGLNPGLLWLWGSSAKPVAANNNSTATIPGSGRCLLLNFSPPTRSYQYKGTDCAEKHKYVCQMEDNTTERRLQRLLRDRKTKDLRLNFQPKN